MSHLPRTGRLARHCVFAILGLVGWAVLGAACGRAEQPLSKDDAVTQILTREAAIWHALQYNPELAALRQQRGIAAAGVVIANTYPFNPIWEAKIRHASGPESAGITNVLSNEHKVLIDVEVRGQGGHRRQAADAALSRAEFEVANQELLFAVRAARAFDSVLYRQEKLRLIDDTVHLNETAEEQVAASVKLNQLKPADQILIRAEMLDSRAQTGVGRTALAVSWADLYRVLGVIDQKITVRDTLEMPPPRRDEETLTKSALERRPDLRARQSALVEAEARLRLEIANRYGNPNVGPAYEYDPTRVNLAGVQFTLPLPVFNRRRGEILQREAERDRASFEMQQYQVQIRQDVHAAIVRMAQAEETLKAYRSQIIPELKKGVDSFEELFEKNDPSVDLLKVLDVRRKLLKARDGYLDALWEMSQGRADLAAAVGDPSLPTTAESPPSKP
jgi:cobalt-zinc-cadmium efflux system outer membrane protein